jgi:chorismate dehydratase
VYGLEKRSDLFELQFHVPAKCASLLYDKSLDLGMIPSIEYLHLPDYHVVPDIAVTSDGPVASVALFTERPANEIRSIAVDASSRTAVALLRILCSEWFEIEPEFVTLQPDLPAMLKRCDAALLIGDTALYAEHESISVHKIDLGEEWKAMTGLPFVWAFWVGRQNAVGAPHVEALRQARDSGLQCLDEIAKAHAPIGKEGDEAEVARDYLRDNMRYVLNDRCRAGLKKFFVSAADLGIVSNTGTLRFF